jgi:peptidoglycan hydrolase CwlO-like protein
MRGAKELEDELFDLKLNYDNEGLCAILHESHKKISKEISAHLDKLPIYKFELQTKKEELDKLNSRLIPVTVTSPSLHNIRRGPSTFGMIGEAATTIDRTKEIGDILKAIERVKQEIASLQYKIDNFPVETKRLQEELRKIEEQISVKCNNQSDE